MKRVFSTISLAFLLAACGGGDETDATTSQGDGHHMGGHAESLPAPASGVTADSPVVGVDGEQIGRAIVSAGPNGVLLRVDVEGLTEGFHGVHLHQVGDCSDHAEGFKRSGSHINPEGNAHGLMNPDGFEQADMPNIYAHHSGHARAELFAYNMSLEQQMDADGFALVVHANEDDHSTQPIGGAGARVGCAAFN